MNVILAHDHSDFDAVAAQAAAWKLRPSWVPVLARAVNRNVRDFLTLHGGALPFRRDEELPPDTAIERALLVDTQSVPTLKGFDTQTIAEVEVADHHARRDDLPEHWTVRLDPTGSCTTFLVEEIAEQGLALSWVEATLLLLGIHEDTGSLVYAGTTPRDVRAAAWLLEQGANLDTVRDFLDHPLTPRQRELYRRLLEGVEWLDVHGFGVAIARAAVDEYVDDVSSLAHAIRELYDPAALLLAVEMSGHVQLVARSTTDEIDVGALMGAMGGGGHPRAAAAFVDEEPLETVIERLKALLPAHVRPAATVAEWMSRGPIRTVAATMRVHEAAARMRRWGHEGFPVLDEAGEVVGVLTRRDVDRALQHKLENAPVTEFMHKGAIAVTPADSIARVRQKMTEWNIGQVPVVEGEPRRMVGIITRTDLLRRMGGPPPADDNNAAALMRRVEAALPAPTVALVRHIAQEADALGFHAFFVGGMVRDLLLGSPVKDLDIVIEGQAIPLARRLAETLGGRVVAHERFGTAKWMLEETPTLPQVPNLREGSIDLITARTEWYERPTALPQVEHASIRQDLHRRDFTINTLAIALSPQREGQLLDFYGGAADLERGLVRVLHNLSFVEDPTRILRAVRFEQRFGFRLEARTEELLRASLDLLLHLSPDRLRHELFIILQEPEPERALARLDELGVLPVVLPDVRWDATDAERLARLRAAGLREPEEALTALIWDPQADPSRIDRIGERLSLPLVWRARLRELYAVRAERDALLAPNLPNSALFDRLRRRDAHALELLAVLTEDDTLRARLRTYLDDLRHRALTVGGEDLRAAGLPPGPAYRRILQSILAAHLDGLAPDEKSQRAMLAEMVETEKRRERREERGEKGDD